MPIWCKHCESTIVAVGGIRVKHIISIGNRSFHYMHVMELEVPKEMSLFVMAKNLLSSIEDPEGAGRNFPQP